MPARSPLFGPFCVIATRFAFVGAFASAFAGPALCQTPVHGGTAVFLVPQDPADVNPDTTSGLPNRMVGCTIHQGLVRVSDDFQVLPNLAKSWSISADGLTYSFDLVKANWHDGKPFTSEDAKYTLIDVSAKYSAVFTAAGKVIDSIDAPAPDKVVIKLKQTFGPFLSSLACEQGAAMLPAHLFRGTDPRQNPASSTAPVGTGPFRLVEWQRGDHLRLVRNQDYWEPGKPYLDEVVAKIIGAPSAGLQALRAGEVDVFQVFPADYQSAIRSNPDLKIEVSSVPPTTTYVMMNLDKKPFNDKRVRQALFLATDRDYLLKNAFFDLGAVSRTPYTSEIKWATNPKIDYSKMYPLDLARANALLDEAGLKRDGNGKRATFRLAIYTTEYPEYQQVSVALKRMWQAIGIDVSIEAMETATLNQKLYMEADFDVALQTFNSLADPAFGIARVFVSSAIGRQAGNGSRYSNPKIDELFEEGAKATNLEERGKYYQEAQVIIADELPVLTLRQSKNIDAATKRLHGLWGTFQGEGDWGGAWLDK